MHSYLSRKERKERCKNLDFCTACFRIRKDVGVDEHHVCRACRNGSDAMPRRLPAITLENGKTYFVDCRLRELRNVRNPYDCKAFSEVLQDAKNS